MMMGMKVPTITITDAIALFGTRKALCEYLGLTVTSIAQRIYEERKNMPTSSAFQIARMYPEAVTWVDR